MNANTTLRLLAGVGIGGFLVWVFILYRSNEKNKSKSARIEANYQNLLQEKEQMHQAYMFDRKELTNYIKSKDQKLDSTLKEMDIKIRKVSQVVRTNYIYRDTIINRVELKPVLDSIYLGRNIAFPFTDSTACIKTKGYVDFKDGNLSVNFTERNINDTIYTVTNWYRKWFLGRKHYKVDIITACGTSKTVVINRK